MSNNKKYHELKTKILHNCI